MVGLVLALWERLGGEVGVVAKADGRRRLCVSRCGMVHRAHGLVMRGWVMFAEVFSEIRAALVPIDAEMVLVHAVLYPKVSHVHGLESVGFNSAISNSSGSIVNQFE